MYAHSPGFKELEQAGDWLRGLQAVATGAQGGVESL